MCTLSTLLDWLNTNAGAITAIATGVIAWFTVSLVRVSSRQAELIGDQIKLAREEFNSTHRPKIRIKHLWLTAPVTVGEEIILDLVVVNHGDTNAVNVHGQIATALVPNIASLPSRPSFIRRPVFGIVSSGDATGSSSAASGLTIEFAGLHTGVALTIKEISEILGEQRILLSFGYIEYRDTDERIRKTAFCRRLTLQSNGSGRFLEDSRVDPDYQYQD